MLAEDDQKTLLSTLTNHLDKPVVEIINMINEMLQV